jgi:hypothetical protein
VLEGPTKGDGRPTSKDRLEGRVIRDTKGLLGRRCRKNSRRRRRQGRRSRRPIFDTRSRRRRRAFGRGNRQYSGTGRRRTNAFGRGRGRHPTPGSRTLQRTRSYPGRRLGLRHKRTRFAPANARTTGLPGRSRATPRLLGPARATLEKEEDDQTRLYTEQKERNYRGIARHPATRRTLLTSRSDKAGRTKSPRTHTGLDIRQAPANQGRNQGRRRGRRRRHRRSRRARGSRQTRTPPALGRGRRRRTLWGKRERRWRRQRHGRTQRRWRPHDGRTLRERRRRRGGGRHIQRQMALPKHHPIAEPANLVNVVSQEQRRSSRPLVGGERQGQRTQLLQHRAHVPPAKRVTGDPQPNARYRELKTG